MPVTECHHELDDTILLGLDNHREFQILLEMLQWMDIIVKPELCQVVSSLKYFETFPREFHLDLAVHYFGCVNTKQYKQIAIDSRPMCDFN